MADTLAVCAAEARRIGGELLPVAGWGRGVGNTALTYRAPGRESRWPSRRSTPRRTCSRTSSARRSPPGTRTIVKAPPQAPASSAAVVELLLDAGMPAEAVQLLHGDGEVGARLCAADEVAVISFTGSAATGDAVARAAGAKRLVLELGGNAATIVCEDADIAAAARGVRAHRVQQLRPELHLGPAGLRAAGPVRRVPGRVHRRGGEAAHRRPAGRRDRRRVDGRRRGGGAGGPLGGGGGRRTAPRWCSAAPATAPPWPRPWWRDPPPAATVVSREVFGALVAVLPYDDFGGVIADLQRQPVRPAGGTVHPRHRPHHHRLARAAGRRAGRQRVVQLPARPRAVRRGQGLRVRPGVAALDDRGLHRGQDAAAARDVGLRGGR